MSSFKCSDILGNLFAYDWTFSCYPRLEFDIFVVSIRLFIYDINAFFPSYSLIWFESYNLGNSFTKLFLLIYRFKENFEFKLFSCLQRSFCSEHEGNIFRHMLVLLKQGNFFNFSLHTVLKPLPIYFFGSGQLWIHFFLQRLNQNISFFLVFNFSQELIDTLVRC